MKINIFVNIKIYKYLNPFFFSFILGLSPEVSAAQIVGRIKGLNTLNGSVVNILIYEHNLAYYINIKYFLFFNNNINHNHFN